MTERLDFVNSPVRSAPMEIWNMGIQLSIAETYDYTYSRSIQFSSITQEYTDFSNLVRHFFSPLALFAGHLFGLGVVSLVCSYIPGAYIFINIFL